MTLIPSFNRSLRAANKSPKTVDTDGEVANQLPAFLRESGLPTEVAKIGREHVEAFIERLVMTKSPATANKRYRALCSLYNFLVDFSLWSPCARSTPSACALQDNGRHGHGSRLVARPATHELGLEELFAKSEQSD